MLVVRCPHCAHEKVYGLAARPKYCTSCGKPLPARGKADAAPAKKYRAGHQQYLDEILAHWQGSHVPAPGLGRITPQQGQILFDAYQHDLGRGRYEPAYKPGERERQAFASAYLLLKQGKRDLAEDWLRHLTVKSPRFADPWLWLAAATGDPASGSTAWRRRSSSNHLTPWRGMPFRLPRAGCRPPTDPAKGLPNPNSG